MTTILSEVLVLLVICEAGILYNDIRVEFFTPFKIMNADFLDKINQ